MRVESFPELGKLLSNTWITCPVTRNNLGKLRTRPDSSPCLERLVGQGQDGSAAYQVVGGVTDPLAIGTRTGCGSNSPEMDSETRIQTLRGVATETKTSHCRKL